MGLYSILNECSPIIILYHKQVPSHKLFLYMNREITV